MGYFFQVLMKADSGSVLNALEISLKGLLSIAWPNPTPWEVKGVPNTKPGLVGKQGSLTFFGATLPKFATPSDNLSISSSFSGLLFSAKCDMPQTE